MIHEYRLDWATHSYRLVDTHQEAVVLESPFPATILFSQLDG